MAYPLSFRVVSSLQIDESGVGPIQQLVGFCHPNPAMPDYVFHLAEVGHLASNVMGLMHDPVFNGNRSLKTGANRDGDSRVFQVVSRLHHALRLFHGIPTLSSLVRLMSVGSDPVTGALASTPFAGLVKVGLTYHFQDGRARYKMSIQFF